MSKGPTSKDATTSPDTFESRREAIAAVGGHGRLGDLEGLTERGDLEHVEAGSQQQVGELDGLLLQLVRLVGRHRGRGRRRHGRDGRDGGHDSRLRQLITGVVIQGP